MRGWGWREEGVLELFGSGSAKAHSSDALYDLSRCAFYLSFLSLSGSGLIFCYLKPRVLTSTFGKSSAGNEASSN